MTVLFPRQLNFILHDFHRLLCFSLETQPFADLRRVKGLDGIYIATKVINATRYSFTVNQVTVMSFNKGGDWHRIPSPERNATGSYTCGRTSFRSVPQVEMGLPISLIYPLVQEYSNSFHGGPDFSATRACGPDVCEKKYNS